jgi:signal transduction histidine kinase
MIVLTVFSLVLIIIASYFQYDSQSEEYNLRRLLRKETQVKNHLSYLRDKDASLYLNDKDKQHSQQEFSSIATIHKVEYALFSLEGAAIFYSYLNPKKERDTLKIDQAIIERLLSADQLRIAEQLLSEKGKFQSSYSVLQDNEGSPYAILYFPYFEDISFSTTELNLFLNRVYQVSFLMLVITLSFAFLLAGFITRPIETLRKKIEKTRLFKGNERIYLNYASTEINSLVKTYNQMLDALEESAEKLAKSEREHAWQEMAKQVAHEIKNPLTPMRLTIQSFQQRFDPSAEDSFDRLNDFSKILIEQVDTMSNVASAFSDFATLPEPNFVTENMVEITRLATEIFDTNKIKLNLPSEKVYWSIDRTQWIRVMTNLIKNALQAIPEDVEPKINVTLIHHPDYLLFTIADNGSGIAATDFEKIFEPKFTTKTGGMGLGLAIVKNIIHSLNGTIRFDSAPKEGTTFYIELTKRNYDI